MWRRQGGTQEAALRTLGDVGALSNQEIEVGIINLGIDLTLLFTAMEL